MGTLATPDWIEREGVREWMKDGRDGRAEAMASSPADDTTPREVIRWQGDIGQLQVATGPKAGRFAVYRDRPLNVQMEGEGRSSSQSVLRSMIAGEQYRDGRVDRKNPAIHRLVWTDAMVDVRNSQSPYPIVTSVETAIGLFGFRRCNLLGPGTGGKVKTFIRGNASGRYVGVGLKTYGGVQEYLMYCNAGPGASVFRDLNGADLGRGVVQSVLRTTENNWYVPDVDDGNRLLIENITATNCGSAGSSAVSVTGWCEYIRINGVDVDTPYNTAAISLRYDKKQALLDRPLEPTKANVIGPGKLMDGYAHGSVTIDLRGSTIRTGVNTPGQASKSSREALMIDSCQHLLLLSDDSTSVEAGSGGNRALHLEHTGNGVIRTQAGVAIGTRAVGSFETVGNFSGWGPMARAGQPISADSYHSPRTD